MKVPTVDGIRKPRDCNQFWPMEAILAMIYNLIVTVDGGKKDRGRGVDYLTGLPSLMRDVGSWICKTSYYLYRITVDEIMKGESLQHG